jgi:acylglycerol lipase
MNDLFTREWPAADSPVAGLLLVHGFAEHCGRYDHLARALVPLGLRVFAYDHRGHGRSPGRRGYIHRFEMLRTDLDAQIDRVAGMLGQLPLYLFGHSMGGLLLTHYLATTRHAPLAGAIISSPLLAIPESVPVWKLRASALLSATVPGLPVERLDASAISRDPAAVQAYEEDPLVYHGPIVARTGAELLRGIRQTLPRMKQIALPLLVLHGTSDRLAPVAGGQRLVDEAASADKTFHGVPDGFHELLNDLGGEATLGVVQAWLRVRIGPCA